MSDDAELLSRFVRAHDNEAFSDFVRRNIDFVFATALRQCRGNGILAQEVTQLVFTDVSRRAHALISHPALPGWLYTTTRFAAMKVIRDESRRQRHDQQAAQGQAMIADEPSSVDWTQLQPVLDDAIGELKERDRTAIVLRFFQGKSLLEVGTSLHLTETAARSCVDRALDRLRGHLSQRGITSTSAALGLTLGQQVATAAPVGLASSISGIALIEGATSAPALVPVFAMKKILIAAAVVAFTGEMATATIEVRAKRELEANYAGNGPAAMASPPSVVIAVAAPPATASVASTLATESAAESAELEKRLAQLRGRPPGVLDSEMKAPLAAGRDTPLDAMQTVTAALRDHDFATLEHLVSFSDDTQENRAAFMANFSEAVRARYQTPERLMLFSVFEVDPVRWTADRVN